MRGTKLLFSVFAVILFTFSIIALHLSNSSSRSAQVVPQHQVIIADGSDPLPRPWFAPAA